MLKIASSDSVFLFNSKLYKQIDGCSMGGPLSPTLANIFMCHYEETWLEPCPAEFKPIYYRRFVDDCFVVFREFSHVKQFHDFINKQHLNLKFTVEIEQEGKLPFVDCILDKSDSSLITSVYRKPTFTGLGLHYFSFIPFQFKINSTTTLIRRAYHI